MARESASERAGPQEPLVTIGLPVFNGGRFLRQSLDALLGQDYRNLEIVVSDNASTDDSATIACEYAERDPRVRTLSNPENLGAWRNAHLLLEEAKGPYFMWAAHDDLWEPTFVRTLVRLLEVSPGAAMAFCAFEVVDEQAQPLRRCDDHFRLPHPELEERLRRFIEQPEELGKANLCYSLFRTETLRAAGGMTLWSTATWGADMLVVFRVLSLGDVVLDPGLLFHKRHVLAAPSPDPPPTSAPRRGWRAQLATHMAYFDGYERVMGRVEALGPEQRERLRRQVRRRARAWSRRTRWRKQVVNPLRKLGRVFSIRGAGARSK